MLDIKLVRSEPDKIAEKLSIKGFTLDTEYLDKLESQRRKLQSISESLQSERNRYSKEMGKAISNAKK